MISIGARSGSTIAAISSYTKRTKEITVSAAGDIVLSGTGITTSSISGASIRAEADSAGIWRLIFSGRVNRASGTGARTSARLTFAGNYPVTFAAYNQAISVYAATSATPTTGVAVASQAYIDVNHASADEAGYAFSVNVVLASEPTWAAANLENVADLAAYFPNADASTTGLLTSTAQTMGGVKTFVDGVKQLYGCHVYLSSANNQTITAGAADATVAFQSEKWDSNGNHASGVYTAPKTGLYYVSYGLRVLMGATAASAVDASVMLGSVSNFNSYIGTAVNSNTYNMMGSGVLVLTATNTISVKCSCTGQNVTIIGSGGTNDVSYFSVIYLGPVA
jgi:hypothetical protein